MPAENSLEKDGTANAVGVILLILAVAASVGNGCLLYVVKRDPLKCFKKPTNMFAVSLTILYLASGLVVLPYLGIMAILNGQGYDNLPQSLSALGTAMSNFVISMGTLLMFALSLERFTSFICPHLNRKWITTKRVNVFSMALSVFCFIFSALLIFTGVSPQTYYYIYLHVLVLPALLGVCLVSIATFWSIRDQSKVSPAIVLQLPMTRDLAKEAAKRNAQRKSRYVTTACVIFLPMVLPLIIYYTAKLIEITCEECLERSWFIVLDGFTVPLVFLYSFLNPILITVRVPEYSRSVKRILRLE